MIYVFDTSAFVTLFQNYYPARFPTLWALYGAMVVAQEIVSTKEVRREIEQQTDALGHWMKANKKVFTTPTPAEGSFVAKIYGVAHFQHNIEQRKILTGGNSADPFVIAKAAVLQPDSAVVTLEKAKANSAKVPTICEHFGVPCLDFEQFMEKQNWTF